MALRHAGAGHYQRHPGRMFKEVHLIPKAFLAQHIAMISGDDDDGIVHLPHLFDGLHQGSNFTVKITDIGIIGPARPADFFIR